MAGFNVDLLEKEMAAALEADRRYQRENDAKFRAINQKVASYEEFRDIVKASHIKSLDKDDLRGTGNRRQPWNPLSSTIGTQSSEGAGLLSGCGRQPESAQEFLRQWRQFGQLSHDQYSLLINLPSESLTSLLQPETSGTIFGDILQVLNKYIDPSTDGLQVCQILTVLGQYPRLSLSIDMLSRVERASVDQLFRTLNDSYSSWSPSPFPPSPSPPSPSPSPSPPSPSPSSPSSQSIDLNQLMALYKVHL